MRKLNLILVLLFIGSSPTAIGQALPTDIPGSESDTSEKLIPNLLSFRENLNDPNQFTIVENSTFQIPDAKLPPIRNQGSTPLCETACVTTLLEYEYCRQQGTRNCNAPPDSQKLSLLSMLMYRDNLNKSDIASIGSPADDSEAKLFQILNKISSNSTPPIFYSEGCFPFDKFVEQARFRFNHELIKKFFVNLKAIFEAAKQYPRSTEADTMKECPECMRLLDIFSSEFSIKMDAIVLARALKSHDFKKFLYTVIFEENMSLNPDYCKEIAFINKPNFEHYPRIKQDVSLDKLIEVILEKVKEERPVILSALCGAQGVTTKLCDGHCLVITGMKTVTKNNGGPPIQLVRVQNSYGKKWNDVNNGGWVRLESLKRLIPTRDDRKIERDPSGREESFYHSVSWIK